MTALFFLMMRTGETYRWRRIFFVALGFLFPFGFIAALIAERGTMSIPISRMVSGDTPFCFMVTPSIILPAAFARTIIFPGSILPTASNPHSIAIMIGLWFALTLVLGKAGAATPASSAESRRALPRSPNGPSCTDSLPAIGTSAAHSVGHSGLRRAGFGGAL